jgi:uncharacterized protein YyaL (SSP411 family)
MAHESFEDPETADLMNNHFINIKVDREERPDLDSIYMSAVVALTGQGGWPMTVALTPDGRPFFGGTYFPPTPRYGMPSFRQLIAGLATAWGPARRRAGRRGDRRPPAAAARPRRSAAGGALNDDLFGKPRAAACCATFDSRLGGFGRAPKFPPSMTLEFLLRVFAGRGDSMSPCTWPNARSGDGLRRHV